MNNSYYLRILNALPQVGPRLIQRCLQQFLNLEELFSLDRQKLLQLGLPARAVTSILTYNQGIIEQEEKWLNAKPHRKIITLIDEEYPILLKEIAAPPPVLYAEGQLGCLSMPTIAIVGSRKPTYTGQEIARDFAAGLVQHNITIISGLARGIDAAVHKGCLSANGKTVAVMGTGMDYIYPKQHFHLYEQILKNGLVLSEFPLKTPPLAGHFPRRNRIISGLSLAVLVVESVIQSGSLLTARFALEQNRDVMAIPGSIRNSQTAGCHYLLKQGAKLVTSVEDVLESLSLEGQSKQLKEKQVSPMKSPKIGLLQCIEENELITIDQLVIRSGQSIEDIICHLMDLELEGVVQSLSGGYMRCIL